MFLPCYGHALIAIFNDGSTALYAWADSDAMLELLRPPYEAAMQAEGALGRLHIAPVLSLEMHETMDGWVIQPPP